MKATFLATVALFMPLALAAPYPARQDGKDGTDVSSGNVVNNIFHVPRDNKATNIDDPVGQFEDTLAGDDTGHEVGGNAIHILQVPRDTNIPGVGEPLGVPKSRARDEALLASGKVANSPVITRDNNNNNARLGDKDAKFKEEIANQMNGRYKHRARNQAVPASGNMANSPVITRDNREAEFKKEVAQQFHGQYTSRARAEAVPASGNKAN